jgi:DNA-binding PadR family transcriptional regulator
MISLYDIARRTYMPRKAMVILTESMFYVLMALQGREMCGIDIAEFIDKHTNGRVQIGPATLYTILGKFEKEKYIKEINVEGRKRTYVITEKGKDAYTAELLRLKQCIADAENVQTELERQV